MGRVKPGIGEFGQWPWNWDLREEGQCVSGSRLCNTVSRRRPGTVPETLPIPGEAVSAQPDAWVGPQASQKPFSWRGWVRLASWGLSLPVSQRWSLLFHCDPDQRQSQDTICQSPLDTGHTSQCCSSLKFTNRMVKSMVFRARLPVFKSQPSLLAAA